MRGGISTEGTVQARLAPSPALRPAPHLVGGEVLDLEVLGHGHLRPTQPPA